LLPCHVSPWFDLEGQVLGLDLGLAGQVLVNITVQNDKLSQSL